MHCTRTSSTPCTATATPPTQACALDQPPRTLCSLTTVSQAPHAAFFQTVDEVGEQKHTANEFTINYVHTFATHYAKDKYFPRTHPRDAVCGVWCVVFPQTVMKRPRLQSVQT